MSFFLDVKYLNQISYRLPLFKKKKVDLWNCRCILCGDSDTNKTKARGFFYRKHDKMLYKCHNCSAGESFAYFLKRLDPNVYNQYTLEKYEESSTEKKKINTPDPVVKFSPPEFDPLRNIASRLDKLPDYHEAVVYCNNRNIPKTKFKQIYFLPKAKDVGKISPEYSKIQGEEPRLLLPFFDEGGNLSGVTLRAIRGEALRYISIKIDKEKQLFFLIVPLLNIIF